MKWRTSLLLHDCKCVVASLQLATIPAKLNDEHRLTNDDL